MREFLESIGIYYEGIDKNGKYIIDLADSNEYDKVLNILEKSDKVEEDEDVSSIGYDSATNIFESDNYTMNLLADFKNDTYKLIVKE